MVSYFVREGRAAFTKLQNTMQENFTVQYRLEFVFQFLEFSQEISVVSGYCSLGGFDDTPDLNSSFRDSHKTRSKIGFQANFVTRK